MKLAGRDRDDITLWVANEESFYNQVMRLYDRWVDEGDAWEESRAEQELEAVVEEIAEALFSMGLWDEPYTAREKREAVAELLSDFEGYRDEEIARRQEQAVATPVKRRPMDEADIEYARKMDELLAKLGVRMLPDVVDYPIEMTTEDARRAGIEYLIRFMPASRKKIQSALEKGDDALNTIKLRKWDEKAEEFNYRRFRLSLSQAVGLLKHVAKWYYA